MANCNTSTTDGTNETDESAQSLLQTRLRSLFGEAIAKAFEDEDITDEGAFKALLRENNDAQIFNKLGLTFGKVVKIKEEFKEFLPNVSQEAREKSSSTLVSAKPTMASLASFSPEIRRVYLAKRKKVGVLALEKWGHKSLPKFHSPEAKLELENFAKGIKSQVEVPEVGFDLDGIIQHIRDYFNEQRRQKKKRSSEESDSDQAQQWSKRKLSQKPAKKTSKLNALSPSSSVYEEYDSSDVESSSTLSATQNHDEYASQDDDDLTQDTESQDAGAETLVLFDSPPEDLPSSQPVDISTTKIPLRAATIMVKSVTGKVLNREEMIKILRGRFNVQAKSLFALSPSQLMEVLARKMVDNKYIQIKAGTHYGDLKKTQLTVLKEIEL